MDGLRYGGGIGQWSWLAHRLSGLGILLFLVIHITDTFFVVFAPDWYDHTVAIYGGVWFDGQYYWPLRWAFRVSELGLIASVVFHAVNGVGIILYDFLEKGSLYRRTILRGVQIIFWGIMIVTTPIVLYPLRKAPDHAASAVADASRVSFPASASAH
jgi:succinate dehydrogenase / fumarate reductase cytochrome b subunit